MLPPAQLLPFAATTSDVAPYKGAAVLLGWAFQESTGTAGALLEIHDGADTYAPLIAPISLAANESTRDYPPGNGILVRTGLYVAVTDGEIFGALWFLPILNDVMLSWAHGDLHDYWVRPGV